MHRICSPLVIASVLLVSCSSGAPGQPQGSSPAADLDARVRKFLDSRRGTWRDMNVPTSDGQELYNIIIKHKYRSALEIGTSTGHSGIWIAWALSKTGGKLVTLEIDRSRHEEALANFRDAGVAEYIDARLGDAHVIVPKLEGPFDFVFLDADKDWYRNYLEAALPKLSVGGCFVAHNVSNHGWGYSREFLEYARSLPFLETTVLGSRGSGMSITYRKAVR